MSELKAWAYSTTGWSAHSGAGGARNWWLAYYVDGEQVSTYDARNGRLRRYGSYETASRTAKRLNAELGITGPH